MAYALLKRINVKEDERRQILVSLGREGEIRQSPLGEETFKAICDWRYVAILLSFDLTVERRDYECIAKRYNLTVSQVDDLVQKLYQLNLLTRTDTGAFRRNANFHSVSPTNASEIVRTYHKQTLDLAVSMLEKIPFSARDYSVLHFAAKLSDLPVMKQEISRFVKRMGVLFDSGQEQNDEVFQISVQCFPVNFTMGES